MKLKRFDEMLNEELDSINEYPSETRDILHALEEGSAVLVTKGNLPKFYKAVSYYDWIQYEPKLDPDISPPEMFWVLIGRKLYWTDSPTFGGQRFEVYEPTW